MAKHLSQADIQAIIGFIYGADCDHFTWDSICAGVSSLVGKTPTRQSLSAHPEIVCAYLSRKKNGRAAKLVVPKPSSLFVAAQRIQRLESEVTDLKRQNCLLLEQFVKIQYNAYKFGLKEWQLSQPLPMIDRERTDEN